MDSSEGGYLHNDVYRMLDELHVSSSNGDTGSADDKNSDGER